MKKLFASVLMGLTLSLGGVSAFATPIATNTSINVNDNVVISGEVGDIIEVGDLIFKIVDPSTINDTNTRASQKGFSISLSGTEDSQSFSVTSEMPYAKVYVKANSTSGDIKFTITKSSPTGTVVSGSSVTIEAGTSTTVYSTNKWAAGTYYANFTSSKTAMSGSASSRIASTFDELDV